MTQSTSFFASSSLIAMWIVTFPSPAPPQTHTRLPLLYCFTALLLCCCTALLLGGSVLARRALPASSLSCLSCAPALVPPQRGALRCFFFLLWKHALYANLPPHAHTTHTDTHKHTLTHKHTHTHTHTHTQVLISCVVGARLGVEGG
jgi:hypothetical protein